MRTKSNQRGLNGSLTGLLATALLGATALVFASSFEAASPRVANTTDPQPATLGTYPDTSLPLSTNATVVPDAAPANTTSINISTSTSFMGTLAGDPATGVVRVTDAHPAGTYTVTVRAFNGSSPTATRMFTLTVTTPVTCTPVTFAAATNFGAGPLPLSVAVGDFNGDGKQDLAVANHGIEAPHPQPGSVWILLGDGAGNFSGTNFASGAVGHPDSVAVGDFNGDGKQDLALAGESVPGVLILLGDGAGNFSAPTGYVASAFAIAVGDFNGDGKQDLAATGVAAWILLGDGAGSFSAPTNFGTGSFPISIATGDFNGDGKQDLAVANRDSNNVSILLGDGAGTFSAPVNFDVGTHPFALAVGDFNGDGKQDLAVANSDSNNVSILLGDGAGTFSATNFATGAAGHPDSVAVGDFNGDGKQDLAVANLDSGNVSILLGDGAGNFSAPTSYAAGVFGIAVGDFNGDGKQDLVTSGASILLRTCAQTPAPTPTATATATATATVTATATIPPTPTPTVTPTPLPACTLTEGFENITTLIPNGWVTQNNSQPAGTTGWFQDNPYETFVAQSGSYASCIVANFVNGSGLAIISNWLLTPPMTLQNGAKFSFWTTTVPVSISFPDVFPDRLQVRMSINGTSQDVGSTATSVGDFTTLLLDINPTYTTTGYPVGWTNYMVTLSGIPSPVQGRLAFRYFVGNGGPSGANSNHIGIDTVTYYCNGIVATPTPATPTPTPSVTPTPGTPVSSVAGTVLLCSNPLPNVRLNVTGTVSRSDLSDGSGNYWFRFLPWFGNYTVTPNKARVAPGANGITTTDVLAMQRHYLNIFLISPGCRLTAADVNADTMINTVDVIAVQRFFLGLTTGIANVGTYQFTPASRTYTGNGTNWTGENYDTVLVGDVAAPFVP